MLLWDMLFMFLRIGANKDLNDLYINVKGLKYANPLDHYGTGPGPSLSILALG